jgi:hypothetical protein
VKKLFLLLALLLFSIANSFAQEKDARSGVKYGILPVLSFNTDSGIILGGEVRRFNYGFDDIEPFENYMVVNSFYNSQGAFSLRYSIDQVRTLGTDIRTSSDVAIYQNLGNYYIGDSEKYEYDKDRFDTTSYYKFKSFGFNVGVSTRFPISLGDGLERTDIKTGLRVVHENPWGTPEDRFIYESDVTGAEGATLTLFDVAFVIEKRNSEFRAQEGFLVDVGTKYAPPIISSHHTLQNFVQAHGFLPLVNGRISSALAARVQLVNTIGDIPYWFKPNLALRGYMYRRFVSDNTLTYNLELRNWIFKLPFYNIELGFNLFLDGGRAFTNNQWDSFLAEHKRTLGFGGVMSIFTPDFILKYDLGFSDEGIGIYLGTGYSF